MGKRRGRGEGSIHKREVDGLWASYLTVGVDQNGKRLRRYAYGNTKREVQEKLIKIQTEASKKEFSNSKINVGEFLSRWLRDSVKNSVRASTFDRYGIIVEKHISPNIGGIRLEKLEALHIQSFYSQLERMGCPARTRQMVHVVLKRALNRAVQWGFLSKNPCEFITKPRVPKRGVRFWDSDNIKVFFHTAKDDRLFALFVVAISTGMRQGELFALRWRDVNFDSNTLSVSRAAYELRGRIQIGEPKTEKSRRCIDLPLIAINALREHKNKMSDEGIQSEIIFCDTKGNVLRRSNFRKRCFVPLIKKSGLPPISFHDLRHSAATLLLSQGIHPKVVQERLGHSQISVTMDTYSHVLPTLQKEAAKKIDDVLISNPKNAAKMNARKKGSAT